MGSAEKPARLYYLYNRIFYSLRGVCQVPGRSVRKRHGEWAKKGGPAPNPLLSRSTPGWVPDLLTARPGKSSLALRLLVLTSHPPRRRRAAYASNAGWGVL